MAVLTDLDTDRASDVLGSYRFDDRLEAVTRYCGSGFPRDTFWQVLDRLDVGDLILALKTDGDFEVRPGRRAPGRDRVGQARRD